MTKRARWRAEFEAWHGLPYFPAERAVIIRRWFELMVENADDLAFILTTEQGQTPRR